jgi:hypothetical protein
VSTINQYAIPERISAHPASVGRYSTIKWGRKKKKDAQASPFAAPQPQLVVVIGRQLHRHRWRPSCPRRGGWWWRQRQRRHSGTSRTRLPFLCTVGANAFVYVCVLLCCVAAVLAGDDFLASLVFLQNPPPISRTVAKKRSSSRFVWCQSSLTHSLSLSLTHTHTHPIETTIMLWVYMFLEPLCFETRSADHLCNEAIPHLAMEAQHPNTHPRRTKKTAAPRPTATWLLSSLHRPVGMAAAAAAAASSQRRQGTLPLV